QRDRERDERQALPDVPHDTSLAQSGGDAEAPRAGRQNENRMPRLASNCRPKCGRVEPGPLPSSVIPAVSPAMALSSATSFIEPDSDLAQPTPAPTSTGPAAVVSVSMLSLAGLSSLTVLRRMPPPRRPLTRSPSPPGVSAWRS